MAAGKANLNKEWVLFRLLAVLKNDMGRVFNSAHIMSAYLFSL